MLLPPAALLLLLLAVGSLGALIQCPKECKCRAGKRGSLTADCSFRSLTAVPTNFPASLTILDMTGNQIRKLRANSFAGRALTSTRAFVLKECQMREIETNSFKGLRGLRKLDLSFNELKSLKVAMFPKALRILDVRGNNDLDCRALKKEFAAAAPKLSFLCSRQARRSTSSKV